MNSVKWQDAGRGRLPLSHCKHDSTRQQHALELMGKSEFKSETAEDGRRRLSPQTLSPLPPPLRVHCVLSFHGYTSSVAVATSLTGVF